MTNRATIRFRRRNSVWAILQVLAAIAAFALPATTIQGRAKKHEQPAFCSLRLEFLNSTEEADFNPFITHLHESIKQNWIATLPNSVQKGEQGLVVVRFTIQKDGTLLDSSPKIVASSRKKSLDKIAIEALRKSAPFDPLPKSFSAPGIELRASFYYNLAPPPR